MKRTKEEKIVNTIGFSLIAFAIAIIIMGTVVLINIVK